MKRVLRALVLFAIPSLIVAQPKTPARNQTVADADRLITAVFQLPAGSNLSTNEHSGRILGDGLAVAIARRFRLRELQDSSTAERVLLLLRYSFSAPEMIFESADKRPGVALVLLDYLAEDGPDSDVRLKARDLADKLAPLRAEADRPAAR